VVARASRLLLRFTFWFLYIGTMVIAPAVCAATGNAAVAIISITTSLGESLLLK
jgi:hypothetical protein